jgi:hypothetical protein
VPWPGLGSSEQQKTVRRLFSTLKAIGQWWCPGLDSAAPSSSRHYLNLFDALEFRGSFSRVASAAQRDPTGEASFKYEYAQVSFSPR